MLLINLIKGFGLLLAMGVVVFVSTIIAYPIFKLEINFLNWFFYKSKNPIIGVLRIIFGALFLVFTLVGGAKLLIDLGASW